MLFGRLKLHIDKHTLSTLLRSTDIVSTNRKYLDTKEIYSMHTQMYTTPLRINFIGIKIIFVIFGKINFCKYQNHFILTPLSITNLIFSLNFFTNFNFGIV